MEKLQIWETKKEVETEEKKQTFAFECKHEGFR